MRIFKLLTVMLAMIPLLGSCSMFQPNEKVIEYDEEVKLHDGSMIWVHIKRHYYHTTGAMGDAGYPKGGYLPAEVEISWDTGFPNVGRKSVFFKYAGSIDKLNDIWYLVGNPPLCNPRSGDLETGIWFGGKCIEHIGTWISEGESNKGERGTYIYRIDGSGSFVKNRNIENLPISVTYNLLSINDLSEAEKLEGKRLNWQQKLVIRKEQGYNLFLSTRQKSKKV